MGITIPVTTINDNDTMIVPITAENVEDCVSAFIKAYNCPPWNYHWTFEKAIEYLQEYMNCKQFFGFALYDGAAVAAAIFAHSKTWWTNKQFMIDEFFVSREKQKMGYGRQMLAHFNQYALANQITSLVLMTNKYMPALNFYEKSGFTTAEQYVFMFKQLPDE
ncbi:GNAT family N-acetyltransferase [Mucilaginibacter sp. L3T2-6]|uniref:GNAT family N-acetyltransferase n=1 Tax=Mucilaginibacter sp. L3T2-6 TaxID=3062491 RepID=UPI0026772288|nr:GNAT family N-acetyltransferase [Mucilaginibacter sp. L3T2-6]MDO3643700.1 GNAT family N-acetyltransferase [Mucilaginibacter sp. L3T2-6]MDV6216052.1 GNAT family N-acetyltransferase [Mucilaginibacter sp. L3T2-6]